MKKVYSTARLAAAAFGVLGLFWPTVAGAEPMDPAFERLAMDRRCHAQGTNFDRAVGVFNDQQPGVLSAVEAETGKAWCLPNNAAFKKLVSQYGFAFAPTAMHSARTTGFGGFHLSIEAAYTKIDSGAQYWKEGTQGPVDPSSGEAGIINNSPQSVLQLYSAKIRKSFGFGLELTGVVGFMPKTSIISGGADVRLSLLEGFRSGIPGILPDVAVGGGVRTITGTPQMQLSIASLDVQVSKPLPIADSSILTPWIGYQYLWIFGDSGLVDLTPGTDAINYCNYGGTNVPRPGTGSGGYDGQPICRGGSALDFNNNVVFEKARLERQRLLFGANYRYEMVMIGLQFITDIVDPADAQAGDDKTTIFSGGGPRQESDSETLEDEDRQWTIVVELGAMF